MSSHAPPIQTRLHPWSNPDKEAKPEQDVERQSEPPLPDASDATTEEPRKLRQIVHHFHHTCALIILRSRIQLPNKLSTSGETRVSRWFQTEVNTTSSSEPVFNPWSSWSTRSDWEGQLPTEPHTIELFVDFSSIEQFDSVVVEDRWGNTMTVQEFLFEQNARPSKRRKEQPGLVVLERWTIELEPRAGASPSVLDWSQGALPKIYKQAFVVIRSIYTIANVLPTSKLVRGIAQSSKIQPLEIHARVARNDDWARNQFRPEELDANFRFEGVATPAGKLSARVSYRTDYTFNVSPHEPPLEWGRAATSPREKIARRRSNNNRPRFRAASLSSATVILPDVAQAYGSLSSYHIDAHCESPITLLREAPLWGSTGYGHTDLSDSQVVHGITDMFPLGSSQHPSRISGISALSQAHSNAGILVTENTGGSSINFSPHKDDRGRSSTRRNSVTNSRRSSRHSGSPASLRGVSVTPKEYNPSSPVLRSSSSAPDLRKVYTVTAKQSGRSSPFFSVDEDDNNISELLILMDKATGNFSGAGGNGKAIDVGARLEMYRRRWQKDVPLDMDDLCE